MKKILSALLAMAMLCGAFALGTAAYEGPHNEMRVTTCSEPGEEPGETDEELRARGEALLRGTLAALSGEFTIYDAIGDGILSYNGTYVASTWGIRRLIHLFAPGTHYTVNRNFRMYFDRTPATDSNYTRQLFTLINLDMPEEFRVRDSRGIIVDFVENGFEFTFFYDVPDDSLGTIWMSTRTSANSRSTNSLHIDRIEPYAISELFNLRWMLPMPGWLYDPITTLLMPYTLLLLMIRTMADMIGISWW